MTTPRIEEHTKELQRKAREKLDNAEVPELWSEDSYKYLYLFLDQIIADTVHQAHQAGRDEVVEEYQKKFVGGGPDGDDIAVMEWLRTLLTKHEAAVLERVRTECQPELPPNETQDYTQGFVDCTEMWIERISTADHLRDSK